MHNATDGSGVLVVLVCTRKLVGAAAKTRSFLGRTRDPYWAVVRQDKIRPITCLYWAGMSNGNTCGCSGIIAHEM